MMEYVMLSGVNDTQQQAHELGQLLAGRNVIVNLIPWNPVYSPEGPYFDAPSDDSVDKFQDILRRQYKLHTTTRREMGQDISGACGQLVVEMQQQKAGGCDGGGSCGPGGGKLAPTAAAGGVPAVVRDIEELVIGRQ